MFKKKSKYPEHSNSAKVCTNSTTNSAAFCLEKAKQLWLVSWT